jgi:CheY-like chemotaxis protein
MALPPGPYWMVDDEAELVSATTSMLAREVGAANVRGTNDPREVLRWMEVQPPSVLLTDIRMPFVSGLELVSRLHQRWGPVPVVVMTAFPTAQVQDDAQSGRFAYLPKPFSFTTLREVLARILSRPAPSAFSGAIAVTMLAEVVQLYGLAGRSGTLRVRSSRGEGEIGFDAGRVVDASSPGHAGLEAFNAILGWASGSFEWFDKRPGRETISGNLSELLIDAYRLKDEQAEGTRAASETLDFTELELDDEVSPPATSSPSNVKDRLERLASLDGFLGAALCESAGVCVCRSSRTPEDDALVTSALAHAELVAAKRRTLAALNLDDAIEDIVITLGRQYHLIRIVARRPDLYFFLAIDRHEGTLAMARHALLEVDRDLVL